MPLIVALPVASASSQCDDLQTELKDKRAANMNQSNEKLQPLERLLALANRKQELGFVVLGKVIDRATLKTVFLSIFAGLCTIIPIILVLSSQQTLASGSSACDLSASQVAKIKGAMLGANASCSFNQTINDVRLKTDDGLSSQHELVFAVRQASVKELSARVWRWMRNVRRTSARCRS